MPRTEDRSDQAGDGSQNFLSALPVECPPALLAKASDLPRLRIAVVNATTPVVLASVQTAFQLGLVDPVLIGPVDAIRRCGETVGWDLGQQDLRMADSPVAAAGLAANLAAAGEVDAIMKGDIKTGVLMKALLDRNAGLRTDRLMSHVFQMTMPGCERALFITDAVLNVLPSLEQKAEIARNAIALLHALGIRRPRVALLSAAETESAAMPSTADAAELARRAADGDFPGALVDGPLAMDLAISPEAAEIKNVSSDVAGRADIVLVPNIETGNALFKAMVYLRSAAAAGIVLGARVPIVLTSRADPAAARVASLALASVYSHGQAT